MIRLLFEFRIWLKSHKWLFKFGSFIYYLDWKIRKYLKYKIIDNSVLNKHNKHKCIKYGNDNEVIYTEPLSIFEECTDSLILKQYLNNKFIFEKSHYTIFEDVVLVGPEAIAVTKNGSIIVDSCGGNIDLLDKCSPKNFINSKKFDIEAEYSCCAQFVTPYNNNLNKNYWHWVSECLMLMEGIEDFDSHHDLNAKIIINNNPTKYQKQSLELLGYKNDDIILWKYNKVYVKKLIVPSLRRIPFNNSYITNPSAINWIKTKYNISNSINNKKFASRICIHRKDNTGRGIVNNTDFNLLLNSRSFTSYTLDNMSFNDQINLFYNAKIIISTHGAGLGNIIFSNNPIIIELIGDPIHNHTEYFRIANYLNFKYSNIYCEYSFDDYKDQNKFSFYKEHDIIVDLSVLELYLDNYNIY